jgi:hypothetical protein
LFSSCHIVAVASPTGKTSNKSLASIRYNRAMAKQVVSTTLMIEILGPKDASAKRIRFVENILRNCIKTLDKDFRKSRIPQMKGFSLRPEKDLRKRRAR